MQSLHIISRCISC